MDKKWLNLENDEAFRNLVSEIKGNWSPAVNNIRWRLEKVLKEHGYEWDWENRKMKVKVEEVESPKKAVQMLSKGRKTISEEKVAEIKKMRLEGHSVRSIAKVTGVGKGTVEKYMKI